MMQGIGLCRVKLQTIGERFLGGALISELFQEPSAVVERRGLHLQSGILVVGVGGDGFPLGDSLCV